MAETNDQTDVKNTDINDKQDNVEDIYVETQPDEFCTKTYPADLTLMIENRPLLVSKNLLVNISPVFDAMFSGNFEDNNLQTIKLPDKKFNDFVEFMRCANPCISKRITLENVFEVFPLAHEYQVKHLLQLCEVTLIIFLSQGAGKELFNVLKLASIYNLGDLTAKCIEKAAERPLDEIEDAGRRHELDINTTNAIKSRMLTNLTTKHKDVFVHIATSQAMNRYLGLKSKQLSFVEAFKNGIVFGDYRKLKVGTEFKASTDMCIDGDIYSMNLSPERSTSIYICIKCKSFQAPRFELLCCIYIKNWINREKDIYTEKRFDIRSSREFSCTLPDNIKTNVLSDKTAGYITEGGEIDFELYLFIVNKRLQ